MKNKKMTFWYIQHNNINLLVIFTKLSNTLKCTNVKSAVTLNNKKVVLLHENRDVYTTHVCGVIDDALLKAMPAIPYVGPFTLIL